MDAWAGTQAVITGMARVSSRPSRHSLFPIGLDQQSNSFCADFFRSEETQSTRIDQDSCTKC